MRPFTTALLLALSAAPALAEKSIGQWTVSQFQRLQSADGSVCDWSFNITDDSAQTYSMCSFAVTSDNGTCNTTQFTNEACSYNSKFLVSGGHSSGFTVIVLSKDGAQAYYGADDAALDAGTVPSQTKDADIPGTKKSRRRREAASNELDDTATTWSIHNVERFVSETGGYVSMSFTIIDGSPNITICTFFVQDPEYAGNPWIMPWTDVACANAPYKSSMGYTQDGNSGILTLISSDATKCAYFGLDNTLTTQSFGDIGPNTVEAM